MGILVMTGVWVLDTALVGDVSLLVVLIVGWLMVSGPVMRASYWLRQLKSPIVMLVWAGWRIASRSIVAMNWRSVVCGP